MDVDYLLKIIGELTVQLRFLSEQNDQLRAQLESEGEDERGA
jgi:hypothetical protein